MLYRRLADLVALIHVLVAVFFFLGAFLAWHHPWVALVHIPLAAWVSAAFLFGWTCPLTPLENRLRRAARDRGYEGGCVAHYLGRLFGTTLPSGAEPVQPRSARNANIVLGVFFAIMTITLYGARYDHFARILWPSPPKPSCPSGCP